MYIYVTGCTRQMSRDNCHTFSSEVHRNHLTMHDRVTQSKPHQLCSVVGVLHQVGDDVLCCTWSSHITLPLPPLGHSIHQRIPGNVVGEGEVVEAGPFVGVVPRYCDTGIIHQCISECGWCSSVCTCTSRTRRNTKRKHTVSGAVLSAQIQQPLLHLYK